MASLHITYWNGLAQLSRPAVAQVPTGLVASESMTITSGSTVATNPVPANTGFIQLMAEADCFVAFGASPNAATATARLALFAGVPQFVGIPDNVFSTYSVAVIERTVA